MIIAIDGPSASGKGTIGRLLAEKYGFFHLDTGLLYRAVAALLKEAGAPGDDEDAAVRAARSLKTADLENPLLRTQEMGELASIVAAIPRVREALLEVQRTLANTPPGAVVDGRDIGTVICPNADVKLYVTASLEERARRRHLEACKMGAHVPFEDTLEKTRTRDARDSTRSASPLSRAQDAVLLDTTIWDITGAFEEAVRIVEKARAPLFSSSREE